MQEQEQLQLLDEVYDDLIISGGDVQVTGANARITLYVDQGEGERLVVDEFVIAMDNIPAFINAIMKATWHRLSHTQLLEVSIADRVGRH